MKRVTIHSIWSKRRAEDRVFTYTMEVPGELTSMGALNHAFIITNQDDRIHAKVVPATTAGDIMMVDGQHWLVESLGFHKLTTKEVAFITLNLTPRDTTFGYKALVNAHLLKDQKK